MLSLVLLATTNNLKNKPITVEKPDSVDIIGDTDQTKEGSLNWCVRSNKSGRASITVRFSDRPGIYRRFSASFRRVPTGAQTNLLAGSRLIAETQSTTGESVPTEFPNGSDCINVTISAYAKNGDFLPNKALSAILPGGVILKSGQWNTESGEKTLCFAATRQTSGTITIKLNDYPQTKTTFRLAFRSDPFVKNTSDRNSFFYDSPVTLSAEIRPWMQNNITSARLLYTYTRRYNSWGKWKSRREQVVKDLACSGGYCQAVIDGDNTAGNRVANSSFSYKFEFKDQNGRTFSKSFRGTLKNP